MKTFLSIGSGPGIGLDTAIRFAREGYRVILTSRNNVHLQEQVLAFYRVKGYQWKVVLPTLLISVPSQH